VRTRQKTPPEHYLRVYVNAIRKKLDEKADQPRLIFTENGIGYRFVDIPKQTLRAETRQL
jgi:DNA-binding response OmpR family regulator